MDYVTAHGMRMPKLGLGTWKLSGGDGRTAILGALELGYRHIDTAEIYGNEADIGAALAETPVARGEIHLTSKVWSEHLAPAALRDALASSLRNLRTDYLDLYLIHWPSPDMDLSATLDAMMRAQQEGLIRAIGVSNFPVALMRDAVERIGAPIACNQVEYHALLDQSKVLAYARAHGIAVVAYSPLAQGTLDQVPVLAAIGRKHGATATQVGLKWLLDQPGVAAVPKAARPHSQRANLDALSITLDDADRAAIAALPGDHRLVDPAKLAPAWD